MTTQSLNDKINELAHKKAQDHVKRLTKAIEKAIHENGNNPGQTSWFREDIKGVLGNLHDRWVKGGDGPHYTPSKEMEDVYRSQILDELLNKLPLVKELVMMKDEECL